MIAGFPGSGAHAETLWRLRHWPDDRTTPGTRGQDSIPGRIIVVQPAAEPITQITVINLSDGALSVIRVMRTAAAADGPESSTGWSGEYQVTAAENLNRYRDPGGGLISVSVTGATITIWGLYAGAMTTPDTFAFSQPRASGFVNTFEGSFTQVDNVATLNMTYTQTSPETRPCSYRYTATLPN